jgi:hypothetical protein
MSMFICMYVYKHAYYYAFNPITAINQVSVLWVLRQNVQRQNVSLKNVQLQNVPAQKLSKPQNVKILKTSKPQNIATPKRPKYKTSQASKLKSQEVNTFNC